MADFGRLSGSKIARSAARAAKFAVRVRDVITRPTRTVIEGASAQAQNIFNSLKRFVTAVPGSGDNHEIAQRRLQQHDSVEQIKLKQRAIAEVQADTRAELAEALEAYSRGRIKIETFGEIARGALRKEALASAIIGVGGIGNLTENVLTAVNRQLTEQFALLDGFIDQLAASTTRDVTAKDRARLNQYANSAFAIASNASRQMQIDTNGAAQLEERRRLGGGEHCEDCLALEGEGWQPAGTLPPIGQGTVCGNSCRCFFQTRMRVPNQEESNDPSV